MTVGNSCCSGGCHKTTGYWWTMLCCLGKERESHSKADKRCSKSRQWKLGTGIATQTLEKLKSCIVRGCVFLPRCSPLYQQQCARMRTAVVWKAVTLASPAHVCLCASENLLLECVVIRMISAVLLVNAGWRRSQKGQYQKLWLRLYFYFCL